VAVTEALNVLETSPPRFSPEEVASIAAELFDLHGEARDLGSERDQTFLVGDGVLKISNTGEDPDVLDLEAKALAHIERIDPELPIARQRAETYDVPAEALQRVIVIGDTPHDIACARAGGATSIAVATGGHSVDELRAAGADVVLVDLSDTEQVLALLV